MSVPRYNSKAMRSWGSQSSFLEEVHLVWLISLQRGSRQRGVGVVPLL
jgi:hypothetical protein